jgi:hypothetical protein
MLAPEYQNVTLTSITTRDIRSDSILLHILHIADAFPLSVVVSVFLRASYTEFESMYIYRQFNSIITNLTKKKTFTVN